MYSEETISADEEWVMIILGFRSRIMPSLIRMIVILTVVL
jgi:hypothetical protein